MPAALRNSPSVAPGCRIGTTGTPGQNFAESFSKGPITAGVSGGGGELGPRVSSVVTFTAGSAASSSSFCRTDSGSTPGKMRQLMLARARCGRAFVACPASNMVATQVVRNVGCALGGLDLRHGFEIGPVAIGELRGELIRLNPLQRPCELVDGVDLQR